LTEQRPPRVFISYSHDTVEDQERVLGLADRLRADGIDAEVDQYNAAPQEGWPLWCERQIETADIVLMVCTETYHRRVSGDEECGKGLGVVWEARIIRQLRYEAGAVSGKFVPVLFSDTSPEQIPTPIKGWTWYVIDTEDGYENLYRLLTGQPRLLRPALGKIRPLPTRRRQWPEDTIEASSLSPAPASASAPDDAALLRRGRPVRNLWRFLQEEKNRQILGWLGGGVVVLAGGVWVVVTFFYSPHPQAPFPTSYKEATAFDWKPKLVVPRDGSTVSQPFLQHWLFKWDKPSGPNSVMEYNIRVFGAKAAYPLIDINTTMNEYVEAQQSCSYITDQNRSGWTWQVRARFKDSSWGEWSHISNFDVSPFDRNLFCQQCASKMEICDGR
jgi:hypothetical protein